MQDFERFVKHLKWESLSLALLMVVLTHKSPYSLWWLVAGFPVVDAFMIGYIISPKAGAFTYNIGHNMTIPTFLIAYGVFTGTEIVSLVGFVWIFHIAVDRLLGYGLKHKESFHKTHLGNINKSK